MLLSLRHTYIQIILVKIHGIQNQILLAVYVVVMVPCVRQESHEILSTCCFVTSLRHFIHLAAYSANLMS